MIISSGAIKKGGGGHPSPGSSGILSLLDLHSAITEKRHGTPFFQNSR